MKQLIYSVLVLLAAIGCKEVFEAPPQALLHATFYNSTTKKAMSPTITLQGVNKDSILYDEIVSSDVFFPLTSSDTTRYIIWLDSKADSIIVVQKPIKKVESVEKGFYYEYKLSEVRTTHNRIDSLKIIDNLVTTKWNENIKLYIHPLPAGGI